MDASTFEHLQRLRAILGSALAEAMAAQQSSAAVASVAVKYRTDDVLLYLARLQEVVADDAVAAITQLMSKLPRPSREGSA